MYFYFRILFECDFTERFIKLLQLIQRVSQCIKSKFSIRITMLIQCKVIDAKKLRGVMVYCFTIVYLCVCLSVNLQQKFLSPCSQQLFIADALNFNTLFVKACTVDS